MPRILSILTALALFFSAGCAMIQRTESMDTERNLAASGFQMKFARTPEQIAKVESLPQRKLTPVAGPDGSNRFVWADAKYCKCLYAGTEAAYDRYQKLVTKEEIAENMAAASMNWGAWGTWGPWW